VEVLLHDVGYFAQSGAPVLSGGTGKLSLVKILRDLLLCL